MNTTKTGMALTGFAAVFTLLALTPASATFLNTDNADTPVLFGMAELTHKNVDGDILASSTVHNRLVNGGEVHLINGVFGATAVATDDKPTLICISDKLAVNKVVGEILETSIASDFTPETAFATTGTNTCVAADIETANGGSSAVMNATFYGSGATGTDEINILEDQMIESIAICDTSAAGTDRTNCATAGALFSAVPVRQTEVGASDSVEVTYTFNLTSPTN
ncbi:hypothetical protein CENSYa_1540 [Cenarchaeum symbiosum A]|uniref:Uncharacterized protein n=1 Tax=Cenarchaeum symbiosum (strain A) TaxID=414004 RepID=A0RXU5_CENSY|nr:hypothetical protein CENSYa_1540 [Cenarchaeum symbiosum A]